MRARSELQPTDFGIEINFKAGTEAPGRVFQAMVALIDAFERIDRDLASLAAPKLQPVILLEDIETGSVRAWLRTTLEAVDDDALKDLNWKRQVGTFLVKAKYAMINFLAKRTSIGSKAEIEQLQTELIDKAEEVGILPIAAYRPPPPAVIANSIRLLSGATTQLREGDSAKYLTASGDADFNLSFRVAPETLEELITHEVVKNAGIRMILKIKKPDFLGESMWEFRYDGRPLEAKMSDVEWLREFREGLIVLHPGDALRATVDITVRYGSDREVVCASYDVRKVIDVISVSGGEQGVMDIQPHD